MPLVRIALLRGKPAEFGKQAGAIVYRAMREVINVPDKDNFQIITEHDVNSLLYYPDYLGIARSDGVIFIQITLSEGRSTALKQALYNAIADGLHATLGVRREDVFINLVEVRK